MERSGHALKNGGSLKVAKIKLGIGKNQMYALRNKAGNVTTIIEKIVKVAEEFYRGNNSTVAGTSRMIMEEG